MDIPEHADPLQDLGSPHRNIHLENFENFLFTIYLTITSSAAYSINSEEFIEILSPIFEKYNSGCSSTIA
jgi:hypothetical protein